MPHDGVVDYVRGMPMIGDLTARINDPAVTERVLTGMADEYAARQSADGVWVDRLKNQHQIS
jgi:hypothetical protein